jgi:hypothetical protein
MPRITDIPKEFLATPFRYDAAIRAGLTDNVLRGPQFRRPFPGVRIPCTLPDTLRVRCQAANLILPGEAAFSHETAAELCALPSPRPTKSQRPESSRAEPEDEIHPETQQPIHVIVPPDAVVPNVEGMAGHTGLDPADVIDVDGLRVVTPERTFFHLSERMSVTDLVIFGDAAVRRWTSREELVGRSAGLSRRRGIVRAREALPLICAGVDSPMETRLRLLLVRAGLPCPEVNRDVFDEGGGWVARPDLSYPVLKIAIEYDGDHHRTDRVQWRRDRARDANLREAGWIVITLTADDVFRYPDRTVARVWHHHRTRSAMLAAAA